VLLCVCGLAVGLGHDSVAIGSSMAVEFRHVGGVEWYSV
jgi:hypothetical protein